MTKDFDGTDGTDGTEILMSLLTSDGIAKLPHDVVRALSERLYRSDLKNQMSVMTSRLNDVEITTRENKKDIVDLKKAEEARQEIDKRFFECSTIAKHIFIGDGFNKLMAGNTINIFYFGFGLVGKNFAPNVQNLAPNGKKALETNKIFYSATRRVGRNQRETDNYYPANAEMILNLFNEKLHELGLKYEFDTAKSTDELRWIACYISAIRLNKEYKTEIDYKNLEKKDLIRQVKAELKTGHEFEEA